MQIVIYQQVAPMLVRWSVVGIAALWLGLAARGGYAASERQDPAAIKQVVEAFALRETQQLPGKVQLTIQIPDARLNLAACGAMEPALAPGSRWWGRANVAVRCVAGAGWTIYVPVQVRLFGQYVVAARPLSGNQTLEAADVVLQSGDLTQVGAGALTELSQAIGRSLGVGLAAGQPLRQEALRASMVLTQGQSVKLIARGNGFSVSAEGKTVTGAREGQAVQVKTSSNQVITGIARAGGVVEIIF